MPRSLTTLAIATAIFMSASSFAAADSVYKRLSCEFTDRAITGRQTEYDNSNIVKAEAQISYDGNITINGITIRPFAKEEDADGFRWIVYEAIGIQLALDGQNIFSAPLYNATPTEENDFQIYSNFGWRMLKGGLSSGNRYLYIKFEQGLYTEFLDMQSPDSDPSNQSKIPCTELTD